MRSIITRSRRPAGHAVVVGGSVAGLVATRVLSAHFARVTLLERDSFPVEGAGYRKGVPQAHHQHVLLSRGRDVLERWFPGFDQALAEVGGPLADYTRDFVLVSAAGRLPRFVSEIELRLCRRIHIDHVLVRGVRALPNVSVREGVSVEGYEGNRNRSQVTGVRLRNGERIHADLVIDASGRGSRTPKWLESWGYPSPREQVVDAHLGYATRLYERPADDPSDFAAVEVACVPPHNPRAAGLWRVEGNRWLLTLIGTAGHHPPTDDAGFLRFASELPDPLVHETISRARPLTKIVPYTGTENRWRHYEHLKRFPDGLLVLGDAFCAFNPIYGQGMTVAALQGEALDAALRSVRRSEVPRSSALRREFYARAAKLVSSAWVLATAEDLRWPSTVGERDWITRLSLAYFELLVPFAPESPALIRTFLRVANLDEEPRALASPTVLFGLLRYWIRRIRSKSVAGRPDFATLTPVDNGAVSMPTTLGSPAEVPCHSL